MKTNKYIKTLAVLAGIGVFTACTDLVTKEVDSKVIITTGGTTNVDPAAVLEGSYNAMGGFTDQANVYAMLEHTSDELMPPTRGVDWSDNGVWRSLYTHTWDPSHSQIFSAWNNLNQNAYNIQSILEAASASAQQKAEAKFLRGYNRYYIMDFWGQMPDRLTNEGGDVNPKVYTRAEAFAMVEADLVDAKQVLVSGGGPTFVDRPQASREAACAMLTRLYLNKAVYLASAPAGPYTFDNADMQKVVDNAVLVKNAGYSLAVNYFDTFKGATQPTTEVIFTAKQGSPQNRVHMTLHYDQNPSGWNGFTTLSDFYAKFDAADKRRGIAAGSIPGLPVGATFSGIGLGFLTGNQVKDDGTALFDTRTKRQLNFTPDVPLSGAATDKGYRVMKYHPAFYNKYVLLRYAEVYLNALEAKFRGNSNFGTTTSAQQDLDALRTARGINVVTSPLVVSLQAIIDERGRELYWEGHRRIDLIRFGKFNDSWQEKGTNTDAHRVLFTIPQLALDSNPNLKQNPGYGGN